MNHVHKILNNSCGRENIRQHLKKNLLLLGIFCVFSYIFPIYIFFFSKIATLI